LLEALVDNWRFFASASSLTNKCGESVSVPDDRWLLDGTTHVVVGPAQLVGELLDLVRRVFDVIVDDCVSGGSGHSLSGGDRNEIELVGVLLSDVSVDDSTWLRILETASATSEESRVHSLADVEIHQLARVGESCTGKCLLDLVDLWAADTFNLTLTNTVSVEDDLGWIGSVGSLECLNCAAHSFAEVVGSFLTNIILKNTSGPVGGGTIVHGGSETENRSLSKAGGMEHIHTTDHGGLVHEWQVIDSPRNSSELGIDLDGDLCDNGSQVLSFGDSISQDDL